jgi:hypothetical protein
MSEWTKVSNEEFKAFVAAYPHRLVADVAQMCDPPMLSYNDFSGGKVWPESMVAKAMLNTAMKGHPCYKGEPDDYFLRAGAAAAIRAMAWQQER